MNLSYISNLHEAQRGGGFSLRNAAAYEVLSGNFGARYFGPVSPQPFLAEKILSACLRKLRGQGDFYFFSKRRLHRIRQEVAASGALSGDVLFFNGFTPWIGIEPDRPYIAWNDCSFHDYIRIYHDPERFNRRDIARIEAQEARWLKRAKAVILRSRYFADRTIEHYGLDPARVHSLKNFSIMDPPESDGYSGAPLFLFISTNFQGKNGPVVLEALAKLRESHPEARLAVVGDMPPETMRHGGNIEWIGFLDPVVSAQKQRLRDLLSEAACLVHPTEFDASPAILVEAAYFGCPVIASGLFAIPEIVQHGETGFLVPDPKDPKAIADYMAWMLSGSDSYSAMRATARAHALSDLTFSQFKADLLQIAADAFGAPLAGAAPNSIRHGEGT